MIDKICAFLTQKIRKEMPDIDDEKAEVINFGLQNIIGEIPKIFIMLGVAYVLGVFKLSLFTFLALFIYKGASEGATGLNGLRRILVGGSCCKASTKYPASAAPSMTSIC